MSEAHIIEPVVTRVELPELSGTDTPPIGGTISVELLHGVMATIEIRLGMTRLTIGEILSLRSGATIELDRSIDDEVDLLLNGQVIGRGHIVAVGDTFGVQVTIIDTGGPS